MSYIISFASRIVRQISVVPFDVNSSIFGPMFDIPKKANCYDCALHASHKGGFCRSRDVKNPCEQIKWNYQPLGKQSK